MFLANWCRSSISWQSCTEMLFYTLDTTKGNWTVHLKDLVRALCEQQTTYVSSHTMLFAPTESGQFQSPLHVFKNISCVPLKKESHKGLGLHTTVLPHSSSNTHEMFPLVAVKQSSRKSSSTTRPVDSSIWRPKTTDYRFTSAIPAVWHYM